MKENLLGSLEQKIMNILWKAKDPLKPAQVQEMLGKDRYAYTTIMTLLSRLHAKGLLVRQKSGKAYFYTVKKSKHQFVSSKLRPLFSNLVEAYGDLAINQFVEAVSDSPENIEILKRYIEEQKKIRK